MSRKKLKIALAHDWLTGMRGGEAVLEGLCRRYPDADLLTLFYEPGSVSPLIEDRRIISSFLDKIPGARGRYRQLLPVFPAAVEALDAGRYDLIVSTSHCAIKALRVRPDARHLCYVHTPMRYIYEQFDDYFGPGQSNPAVRAAMCAARPILQRWDKATAHRPSLLVANSEHVRKRIRRHWRRDAALVYPPVDTRRFGPPVLGHKREYFLLFGALAPYKRADLAIAAFNQLGWPLKVAGGGPDLARLKKMARPNVELLGRVADDEVLPLYQGARALIFPGEEDFGITPLEAHACATPVIAFGRGGALETVRGLEQAQPTGLFFAEQKVASLVEALHQFVRVEPQFAPAALLDNAQRFAQARFDAQLAALLDPLETELGTHR